ncbi:Permease-like protein 1 [Elsinoe fawcettii]|nr:Permease-like protein 1 [Elsinoe fawcettii]
MSKVLEVLRVPTAQYNDCDTYINDDIRPLPPHRRTWNTMAFISFWAINQIALSNWQLGASLVAAGLSVWQAVIAIIVGKVLIALVAVFNGKVGAVWHVGFVVISRYIWGIKASYFALVQRIMLSLVWFAVQSWTGGLCVQVILSSIFPSFQRMRDVFPDSAALNTKQFIGWVLFNVLMIPVIYIPPERIKKTIYWMNVVSLVTLVCMMIWSLNAAGGGGPLLSAPAKAQSSTELGWAIVSGVTTTIGSIAVGLTNQPDYSRFARKPGDQVFGQYFSIITLGTILPLFGCLTSSATQGIYGTAIWNPPDLAQKWLDDDYNARSRAGAFFAGLGLVTCQLAINSIDNAFSAGMDLAGILPQYINIRRGAYIGLVLSIALCPWELLSSAATFINVLSAYSVFLGPMVGIQICDYFIIRKQTLKLSDLYHGKPEGIYYFWNGVNWRTFISWTCGFASQLPGFINAVNPAIEVPTACKRLYALAYPLGFAISFVLHLALNTIAPPAGLGERDEYDLYNTFSEDEASNLDIVSSVQVAKADI